MATKSRGLLPTQDDFWRDLPDPPIYSAVVADHADPFTIDQRYADEQANLVPERDPLVSVDAMNRPALRDELLSRGITTIEGRRLANTSTALMRVALANARWNKTGEA